MWKAVRGAGLAYGAAFDLRVESRHVTFSISDSPNAPAAYKAAGQLIEDLVMGKITITETMLESAKSMLVFDIVQGLATGADAVSRRGLGVIYARKWSSADGVRPPGLGRVRERVPVRSTPRLRS